jgi:hypothetical protein
MKEKTKVQLPKELQEEIIVVAHCCCAGSTKHAGGQGGHIC